MYRLEVFYDGKLQQVEKCNTAADIVTEIPRLLKEHDGCEKIVVWHEVTALFAVDCKGHATAV